MFNEMFGLDGQVAVVKALQLPAGRLGTAASSWVAGLGCWTGLPESASMCLAEAKQQQSTGEALCRCSLGLWCQVELKLSDLAEHFR